MTTTMNPMMTSDRGMTMNGPAMMSPMMSGMSQGMSMMPSMMSSMMPAGMMMAPRCKMTMTKTPDGMKVMCVCDDKTSAAMMQNLCMMMANGMMGCCMTLNGMMVCNCSMSTGMCKVEMMEMGCTFTCTSADPMCCKMIHMMCDCMMGMMMPGCTCYLMMNGMPMCCMVC